MKKVKKKVIEIDPTVSIGHLDDGWIVRYPHPNVEGDIHEIVKRNRDDESHLQYCQSVRELLWLVMQGISYYTSKHESYNVRVIIEDENGKAIDD